jgi:hypothetical protein
MASLTPLCHPSASKLATKPGSPPRSRSRLHGTAQRTRESTLAFMYAYPSILTAALSSPLGFSQVYSIAAAFITSCPASNPTLPVKAFPAASIVGNYTQGGNVKLDFNTVSRGRILAALCLGDTESFLVLSSDGPEREPRRLLWPQPVRPSDLLERHRRPPDVGHSGLCVRCHHHRCHCRQCLGQQYRWVTALPLFAHARILS